MNTENDSIASSPGQCNQSFKALQPQDVIIIAVVHKCEGVYGGEKFIWSDLIIGSVSLTTAA